MKEVIYLVVDNYSVKKMTKKVPTLARGEHVIKTIVEVKQTAFRDPLLTKEIVVEDWREGIDISDVEFKDNFITEAEAKVIRENRLKNTIQILESQGYKIEKKAE